MPREPAWVPRYNAHAQNGLRTKIVERALVMVVTQYDIQESFIRALSITPNFCAMSLRSTSVL